VVERPTEEIIRDLEKAARRARPFVIIGLFVIFASLAASVFYLNLLRQRAERERDRATEELAKVQALQQVVRVAAAAGPGASDVLREARSLATNPSQRPPQLTLQQLELKIFICQESSPQNRDLAIALQKMRQPDWGRWQRNYLAQETNAQPIYQLRRNEVRYNPDEEDAANWFQQTIRDKLGADVVKVLTYFPTPRSVSVFFCQGANPPAPTTSAQLQPGANAPAR
jgi:hypothetical protein